VPKSNPVAQDDLSLSRLTRSVPAAQYRPNEFRRALQLSHLACAVEEQPYWGFSPRHRGRHLRGRKKKAPPMAGPEPQCGDRLVAGRHCRVNAAAISMEISRRLIHQGHSLKFSSMPWGACLGGYGTFCSLTILGQRPFPSSGNPYPAGKAARPWLIGAPGPSSSPSGGLRVRSDLPCHAIPLPDRATFAGFRDARR